MQTFYNNLTSPYNDMYAAPYPHPIDDGEAERKAEEYMKQLINDWDKCDEMELHNAVYIRLKNRATGQATNRTFFVSHRNQEGTLDSGKPRSIHRFNEHGQLQTVGTRTSVRRKDRPSHYTYQFWAEPQPYGKPPPAPKLKPRQEETIKVVKPSSLFHPEKRPSEGQVRLTYSFTNEYEKSLTKREALDNATIFKLAPDTKKCIKLHCFPPDYTGNVLRFIATNDDGITVHYFPCNLREGNSNKFDVLLRLPGTLAKNWAPKKHLPLIQEELKAYYHSVCSKEDTFVSDI